MQYITQALMYLEANQMPLSSKAVQNAESWKKSAD